MRCSEVQVFPSLRGHWVNSVDGGRNIASFALEPCSITTNIDK